MVFHPCVEFRKRDIEQFNCIIFGDCLMTMDDILSIQGITVADIALLNNLQKSIKANRDISFLGGAVE